MSKRALVLTHQEYDPPANVNDASEKEFEGWKTEYDVSTALTKLGYEVRVLGNLHDIANLRDVILEWKPDVAFNLMEEFGGEGIYVPFVLGYLELMRVPFTGCNPTGLILADSKETMKKLLRYHRIPAPDFMLFPRGRRLPKRPARLKFPLIVKSARAHGSVGIAQASVVTSDSKLEERVEFIHSRIQTDAIAEEYIEGRELYVGMMGNIRLETFPVWEMRFTKLSEGTVPIATSRVKWDLRYQEKMGIQVGVATDLPDGAEARIFRLCRRVYRLLGLSGYARMDFRLTPDGRVYLLEPNPNPDMALDEDYALAAKAHGLAYPDLVRRILSLGIRYFGGRPMAGRNP